MILIRPGGMLLVIVALQGAFDATGGQPKDLFAPRFEVPKVFSETVCESWESSANRYRGAFQRGWQACLDNRTAGKPCRDLVGNGWPSEAQGYADGYGAADEKFDKVGRSIGVTKAHDAAILYLRGVREAKERAVGKPEPTDACDGKADGKQ